MNQSKVVPFERNEREPPAPSGSNAVVVAVMNAFPAQPWPMGTVRSWAAMVESASAEERLGPGDWVAGVRRLGKEHSGGPVVFGDLLASVRRVRLERCANQSPDHQRHRPKQLAARSKRNPLYPRVAMEIAEDIRRGKVSTEQAPAEFERRLRAIEEAEHGRGR